MDRTIGEKIYALRPKMSEQLRRVADFILRNGNQSCFLNANDLASASGVSPSCVVRFAQRLGYDGFYSFRSELQNKVREHLGYSERVSKTLESVSKKSILRQSFQHDIELLKNTASSNSEEDFAQATNQICRAASVYILGQRSSNALAYFLHFRLSRFGINCKLMIYGGMAVLSELAPVKKGDLLIVTGFNRIPKEMCAAVGMAKARRAKVIAITVPPASAISGHADTVLFVDRGTAEQVQSITAGMALCQALVISVASRMKKRSSVVLNEIDAMEKIALSPSVSTLGNE
jgi:DNA-binding MurR/RpiR family transcriptional regulator